MKDKKRINLFLLFAFFCFAYFIYRLSFLVLASEVDGVNLKEFADQRSVVRTTLKAKRGSILDRNGEYLAQNVSSYTLIAYLDPSRSEGEEELYHVKDKKMTAKKLATVISLSYEEILEILNQKDLYQVEFGNAGAYLTELEKERIESLHLPGIDFIADEMRYYPSGAFLAYTLGYAKKNDQDEIEGEFGLESLLNDVLSGTNGYTSYQKDVNGYKIAGTKEITVPAVDGNDVYLTVDSNIQFFIEQAVEEAYKKYPSEWMSLIVCDAKTGAILGLTQEPAFDPNIRDIENWYDISVSSPYEPGSIMKIYTYMAAMEKGTYRGNDTFASGKYVADDGTVIYDWLRSGFGKITFDQGFMSSSNVGVINMMNRYIDRNDLLSYFEKMGFGKKTGITLANEASGKVSFQYQTEIYNAAFGQGITTTPMQHIQALTSIANDGVMLRPYIIDKVVDEHGDIVYEGKKEEIATVASHETTAKIRKLMYDTVQSDWYAATGSMYRLKGYDVIGKTGTAQLVNSKTGAYYTSDYYTIKTFVGMWPYKDPEVIIYASVKKPQNGSSKALSTSVKQIVRNVSKYLNLFGNNDEKVTENKVVSSYQNQTKKEVLASLKKEKITPLVLGDGNKIIDQYPKAGEVLGKNDSLILVTEGNYVMPNLTGYSKKNVSNVCSLLKLDCTLKGYGYVKNQSVKKGTKLKEHQKITFQFHEIYGS